MASFTKRGEYQWQAQVRRKGVNVSKNFLYKEDAEAWARKVEREIDRGTFINTDEAERKTLGDLIDDYEKDVLPTIRAQAQEKSRLRQIREGLGKKSLASITTAVVLKYRNSRLEKLKPNSVNREITSLLRLMSYAYHDCKIHLPHGVPQVRKLQVDDARDRRVSDEEIHAICKHTESHELPIIVRFALETGFRRSQISGLKREHVFIRPDDRYCRLVQTKNGTTFNAAINSAAAKIIEGLPARVDRFLFGLKGESISQAFDRARDRARKEYEKECNAKGIKPDERYLVDLHFHDLRHEAISRLAQRVPNVIELSRITGHRDLKMLDRYYQISTRELVRKLG